MAVSSSRLGLASLFLLASAVAGCSDDAGNDGSGGGGGSSGVGVPTSSGTNTGGGDAGSTTIGVTVGSTGSGPCSTAVTCEDVGAECGQISDGCNGVLECGTCEDGLECGGDPQICQVFECQPVTCADVGATCGPIGDGCGGLIEDCGTCSQPETCGGDGPPAAANQCSIPASCTGLCLQQVTCDDPAVTTTITGVVYAPGRAGGPAPGQPGGPDPLFDALVYIPNGQVLPFEDGVQCSQCGEEASGDPLVSARTDYQGRFVLENVPVGADIPMVIQLGRWRRQVTIPATAECADTVLDWNLTRLPRNQAEGDIPQIAISTGSVDGLECVLRKIGIEDSEFTAPSGNGRVHLYQGSGSGGQRPPGNNGTTSENALLDSDATLHQYDMVLFPCQGNTYPTRATAARRQNLVEYTDAGGRIFATHYSYDWMHNTDPFSTIGDWDVNGNSYADEHVGLVNMGFPKGEIFANWLLHVGASTTLGEMDLNVVRQNIDSVVPELATEWMSTNDGQSPLHVTFNTPVGAEPEDQCGRALFSDFHIANDSGLGSTNFPNGCDGAQAVTVPMTPQEKLVEFMLFDLGSCLTPDVPPPCEPFTCEQLELECGPAADGCNGIVQCGDCPPGETCGGGGEPGVCGNMQCIPKTCQQLGKNCGMVSNTCGELIDCGDCTGNQSCGGGGVANVCGGGIPG